MTINGVYFSGYRPRKSRKDLIGYRPQERLLLFLRVVMVA